MHVDLICGVDGLRRHADTPPPLPVEGGCGRTIRRERPHDATTDNLAPLPNLPSYSNEAAKHVYAAFSRNIHTPSAYSTSSRTIKECRITRLSLGHVPSPLTGSVFQKSKLNWHMPIFRHPVPIQGHKCARKKSVPYIALCLDIGGP